MKIHAAFNAALGEAVSIRSAVVNGVLVIAQKSPFDPTRKDGEILIVNSPLLVGDVSFSSHDFQAAFEAYRVLRASGQLLIVNDLAQFKPDNVVDYAGQKESGDAKYNVQMLNNGHWAILASCQHYLGSLKTTRHVENTIEQIDRMAEIYDRQDRFFITI